MDFYGRNDISLGGFLERYCFRDDYACPNENCGVLMTDHTRRFVHEQGMLSVVMKRIESAIPGYENSILMWAWCRNCRQVRWSLPNKACLNKHWTRKHTLQIICNMLMVLYIALLFQNLF